MIFGLVGIFLIIFSMFLLMKLPFLAVIFAGIGNALFHICGGIVSLNLMPKKATMPGIFVAPGAIGLAFGTLAGKTGNFFIWPIIFLLIIAGILMFKIKILNIDYSDSKGRKFNYLEIILILILISISIRGFVGLVLVFPWTSKIFLFSLMTFAIVLGKALGGILGDRFGWINVALIGLLVSAPLLSFYTSFPILAIIGLFFFNLTMPITLTAIANIFPGRAGFAFGLTTLALAMASIISVTKIKFFINSNVIFVIILISVLVTFFGLKFYYKSIKKMKGGER